MTFRRGRSPGSLPGAARCSHSWGRMTTKGPIGSPNEARIRFMYSLSIPTAEESTPAPT